jgi:hypothetical protein
MTDIEILEAIEAKRRKKAAVKKPKEEANAAGALPAIQRPGAKEAGIKDGSFMMRTGMDFIRVKSAYPLSESARFVEADKLKLPSSDLSVKVILISEGLGNRKNMNYYGPEAVTSAPAVFEGKPCFLDHPSESDERDIPERRVRDKIGFFKNCHVENEQGVSACFGDLIFDSTDGGRMGYQKAQSAIKYRDHFPNTNNEYVGLSVNADGASEPREMQVNGETLEVNYVTRFTDAMSCDIVTSPARGGKFLALVESAAGANKQNKQEVMTMIVESLKAALADLQEAQRDPKLAKEKTASAARRLQPMLKDAIEAQKRVGKKAEDAEESKSKEDEESDEESKKKAAPESKESAKPETKAEEDGEESADAGDGPDTGNLKPGHKMSKTTKVTVAHDAPADDGEDDEDDEEKGDDESEAEEANRLAVHSLIKESGLPKDALDIDYLASIGLKEARKEIARAKKISESVTARVLKTLDVPSAHYGKVAESNGSAARSVTNNNAMFADCMK